MCLYVQTWILFCGCVNTCQMCTCVCFVGVGGWVWVCGVPSGQKGCLFSSADRFVGREHHSHLEESLRIRIVCDP